MSSDLIWLLDIAISLLDEVQVPAQFPGLDNVRLRLREMRSEVVEGKLPRRDTRRGGLARMVVDSWPLASPETTAVVEAEKRYLVA